MRTTMFGWVLLGAVFGAEAHGETAATSSKCSPVLVHAARSSGAKPVHLTGRVTLADGGKARASITVVRARRDSAVGLLPIDVGAWNAQVGSDGGFDLELPKLEKDEGFMVWAAAEGYQVSCEAFVLPEGVELEFILAPKRT